MLFIRNVTMIVIAKLKSYLTGIYIFCIIIRKFGYWKELNLVILFKIDKSLEVGFYCTIFIFDLLINL